jgi:general secretion pathway protein L
VQFINIQFDWKGWWRKVFGMVSSFNSFVELARKSRPEVLVSNSGFKLFRQSNVDRPLSGINHVGTFVTLSELCTALRKAEEVILSIPSEECFSLDLTVPKSAIGKIDQILNLEIARVTPFTPSQVFSGWTKVSDVALSDHVCVRQFIIRKNSLGPVLESLKSNGNPAIAIIVRQTDQFAAQFALAPDGRGYALDKMLSWQRYTLASFLALLMCLGVLTTTVTKHFSSNFDHIQTASVDFEKDAVDVRKKLEVLKATHLEIGALMTKKRGSPSRVATIEELSRILPDDAFVDGMSMVDDQLVVDGTAAKPEALLSILEASSFFKNVAFNAPVFQNPGESKSRFSLKFALESVGPAN